MTLIALEEHLIPADLVDQVWPNRAAPEALRTALMDIGEQRLRVMDETGIDMQVLSPAAPAAQGVPAEQSVTLARALNDRVADAMAAHPRPVSRGWPACRRPTRRPPPSRPSARSPSSACAAS